MLEHKRLQFYMGTTGIDRIIRIEGENYYKVNGGYTKVSKVQGIAVSSVKRATVVA